MFIIGSCLLELTGHSDLVTNLDYKCGLYPRIPSLTSGPTGDEIEMLDVIVAVSDDKTARAFHFSAKSLSL